jgi:hypothetical protein
VSYYTLWWITSFFLIFYLFTDYRELWITVMNWIWLKCIYTVDRTSCWPLPSLPFLHYLSPFMYI